MAYAHNGDVELYYDTFGNPVDPTLLLVNGLGSQCINFAEPWCEKFVAKGFFVIRFDNRDVGLSTKLPDVAYTLRDMARDAIAVLAALGIEQAHVMGLSMGGMIVQTMAIEHPERLLSMTSMMSTTGDPDVGLSSPEARKLFTAPGPTDRESYVTRHLDSIRTWGSPAFYDEDRLRANANAAFDRCFSPDGQARQGMATATAPSRTDALRRVRIPTLVVHGSEDKLIDASGGRRTAEAIPGARFVLIDGMGHDYPPQLWDQYVQLVYEMLVATTRASAGT